MESSHELVRPRSPLTFGKTPLFHSSWLLGLLGFIVTFLPCAVIVQSLVQKEQDEIIKHTRQQAQAIVTKLEGTLEANIAVGRAFRVHVSVLGDLDQAGLNSLGQHLFSDDLHIRHIALAPDLVISAIYPLAGNEAALGLDYNKNTAQKSAALRAIENNQIVLAGPLQLVQGGQQQLIARLPVYLTDGQPWGLIALVIKFDELLQGSGIRDLQYSYDIALRGQDGSGAEGSIFWGQPDLFKSSAERLTINVPGGSWQLAIQPHRGWGVPHSTYLAFWLIATLLSLCVAFLSCTLRKNALQRAVHLKRLETLSAIDPLTKLTSRYQFNHRLKLLIQESQRNKEGFALLYIDLDHFKQINDSLGHAVGDQLLIAISQKLKASMRSYDLLSRISGDEFVLVLRNLTQTIAIEKRVEAISKQINTTMAAGSLDLSVTCSIGIAVYPADGNDVDTLIKHADRAMYEGKRSGRNVSYFFNTSMRDEADRYIKLTAGMKRGLDNSEFQVYYQPIFDLHQKKFTRCEALCRWISPTHGAIPPSDFIPVAEKSGFILPLSTWVTEEVLKCYQETEALGHNINFSLNRSAQEFNSTRHTEQFIETLAQSGIPEESLTLEITESLLMYDSPLKSSNFDRLKALNLNFSIDDFGTGYSAINYLRKYPVESLKIDRSFTAQLGVSKQADTLVKVILQMAHTLSIACIAEGVETDTQLACLRDLGCRYIQGFYYAKPMPKTEFLVFLSQQRSKRLQGKDTSSCIQVE